MNKLQIGATLCAFANDFYNQNGGWVIIGIEAPEGEPALPPAGINPNQIEGIQQEIRVLGRTINPSYHPVIYTAELQDKLIVVVYAPAGEERPYMSNDPRNSKNKEYFIREGAETVKADKNTRERLIQVCSKVPFDDRINTESSLEDIDALLIRDFLVSTGSSLLPKEINVDTYKALRIIVPYHDSFKPKNIGLLFFNYSPHTFFPSCLFEIVQFSDVDGGNIIEERKFVGSISKQISEVINYLDNLTASHTRKIRGQAEVERSSAFPYEALEEAIVNAAYHRDYDSIREPNKVYLYPNRMEIISYPGPVPGIELEDFRKDSPIPPVPLRNRRIGEILKELRLAEMRSTGIPKIKKSMRDNGSGEPVFEFDPPRTYFRVILPAHPRYVIVHTLREAAYEWSIGEKEPAKQMLFDVFRSNNGSGSIAGQLIEYCCDSNEEARAKELFQLFHKSTLKTESEQPYLRYFRCLINSDKKKRAKEVINLLDDLHYLVQPIETAVAFKRVNEEEKAHIILSRLSGQYEDSFTYLRNFAEVKIALSNKLYFSRRPNMLAVKRLQREALDLLQRAIPLAPDDVSKGWCYFNLGRVKTWLRMPSNQIDEAFKNAVDLVPEERTFSDRHIRFKQIIMRKSSPPDK